MRSIAFFRNLNQGQRRSPTSAVLESEFGAAGASEIVLFQSNGTVVFSAENPVHCAQAVANAVHSTSERQDIVFVRSLRSIIDLVHAVDSGDQESGRTELTLFDESLGLATAFPRAGRRCTLVSGGNGYALCLNDREGESNGTPTLERMLGVKVTSRGLATLRRLLEREEERHPSD